MPMMSVFPAAILPSGNGYGKEAPKAEPLVITESSVKVKVEHPEPYSKYDGKWSKRCMVCQNVTPSPTW